MFSGLPCVVCICSMFLYSAVRCTYNAFLYLVVLSVIAAHFVSLHMCVVRMLSSFDFVLSICVCFLQLQSIELFMVTIYN